MHAYISLQVRKKPNGTGIALLADMTSPGPSSRAGARRFDDSGLHTAPVSRPLEAGPEVGARRSDNDVDVPECPMIFVNQTFGLANASLRVRAGISRGPGLYYAKLGGIRWDGRVLPRNRHARQDWHILLFVARGRISVGPEGPEFEANSVGLFREAHIFSTTTDSSCLRALDWESEGIALRVHTKHVRRATQAPCRVDVSETLTAALRAATAKLRDENCTEETARFN